MTGPVPLHSQIVLNERQRAPEELCPQTIHLRARGQWIFAGYEPAGQIQARGSRPRRIQRAKELGNGRFDDRSRFVLPIASRQDTNCARFLNPGHRPGARHRFGIAQIGEFGRLESAPGRHVPRAVGTVVVSGVPLVLFAPGIFAPGGEFDDLLEIGTGFDGVGDRQRERQHRPHGRPGDRIGKGRDKLHLQFASGLPVERLLEVEEHFPVFQVLVKRYDANFPVVSRRLFANDAVVVQVRRRRAPVDEVVFDLRFGAPAIGVSNPCMDDIQDEGCDRLDRRRNRSVEFELQRGDLLWEFAASGHRDGTRPFAPVARKRHASCFGDDGRRMGSTPGFPDRDLAEQRLVSPGGEIVEPWFEAFKEAFIVERLISVKAHGRQIADLPVGEIVDCGLERLPAALEFGHLFIAADVDDGVFLLGRKSRPGVGPLAVLLDIGKKGLHAVKIACGNRVELVVMAFGATHGLSEPGCTHSADAICHVLGKVLLVLGSALGRLLVHEIECCRRDLVHRRPVDVIARELLDREPVEWNVGVERLDDVVAIRPDAAILVGVITPGVGIAHGVKPGYRLALAVVR